MTVNSTASAATTVGDLQLKAPAQLLAGTAQAQHEGAQRQKGQHHPGGVGQAADAVAAAVVRRVW
jgi:hypothetical protein